MSREDLINAITDAIQREHGYTQHGVGETVLRAIEASVVKIGFDPVTLRAVLYPATSKESLPVETVTADGRPSVGWGDRAVPAERGWHWVREHQWGSRFGEWVPAEWRPGANCFYSADFCGVMPTELIIGKKLLLPERASA